MTHQISPSGRASLLATRDFRVYWLGQLVAMLGDQFFMLAFPWLVLQLTGNGLAMGAVLALMGVPRALLMLLGGALTDRFSAIAVLRASTVGRLGLAALLAALTLGGGLQIWMLYAFALVFGVVDAFAYPAATSILPRLVERDLLSQANALVQGTSQVAVFLGPVLAGALVAALSTASGSSGPGLFGIGVAIGANALAYVVSALTLSVVRGRPSEGESEQKPEGVLRSIREGLRAVWNDESLRAYFILIAGMNLLISGPFAVGIPLLAQTRLVEGVTALGIVMSAYGGGSLLGIVLGGTTKVPFEKQSGRLATITSALGLGLMAFGLTTSTPMIALISALMGAANGYVVVQFMTWLQRRTPAGMLGRTMSLLMFSAVGLQPLSTMAAGAIADLHMTAMFVGAGLSVLVLVTVLTSQPAIRNVGRGRQAEQLREAVLVEEAA